MKEPQILIVEDNPINALVLSKSLEKQYHCEVAANDKEAFKLLEEMDFSLILMDINLGADSLDGVEIMKTLKGQEKYRGVKIFAVTSYAMPEDRKRFLSEGFDDYFPKPIARNQIIAAIAEVFVST